MDCTHGFPFKSIGWTMLNTVSKYIYTLQLTNDKGAMILTHFLNHYGMASCLSTLVLSGFI